MFGKGRLLDVESPLDRNGKTFLVVHLGIRSSFLKANYVPYLRDAVLLALLGGVITMVAAAVLAALALRPIEEISRQLEELGAGAPAAVGRTPWCGRRSRSTGWAGRCARPRPGIRTCRRTWIRCSIRCGMGWCCSRRSGAR